MTLFTSIGGVLAAQSTYRRVSVHIQLLDPPGVVGKDAGQTLGAQGYSGVQPVPPTAPK
jgi:hypothetical protein